MDLDRPLVLRKNPSANYQTALDESVEAIEEYLSRFTADERPVELALLIAKTSNKMEAKASPEEAQRYHALGFHALEEVQHK